MSPSLGRMSSPWRESRSSSASPAVGRLVTPPRCIAVIVISHNLTDVFAVADRIAVMYLGNLVSSGPVVNYDPASAVDLITTGESSRTAA